MIELRLLEHALALRDQRSFRVAAKMLHLSQPALSRSIQNLEQQVGTPLFDRGRRAVLPTAAGLRFLERATALVAASRDLGAMFGDTPADEPGEIAVGAGPYAAEMILGAVAARMLHDVPRVRLRLVVDEWMNCVQRVRSRELDLCVAETGSLASATDLTVVQMAPHQGYFVVRAGHQLGKARKPDLGAVLAYPVVSASRLPPRLTMPLAAGFEKKGRSKPPPFPAVTCDQVSLMRTIVEETDAVGLFALAHIEQGLRRGSLRVLPLVPAWLCTAFGLIYLKDRDLPPLCRTLMDRITERDRELLELEAQLRLQFVPSAG